MKFETIIFTLAFALLILGLILMFGMAFEVIIQGFFGQTLTYYQDCKLDNGQRMVDQTCEKKTKCLNTGFLMKTCKELQNDL